MLAGQGTLGLELAEQGPDVETVVIPIGGGGLAAGIALALRELRPNARLVGVQTAACAPFAGGEDGGNTIADGIAVKHPGELTSSILREGLDDVVTVTDAEIARRSCSSASAASSWSRAPARRLSPRCSRKV